MTGENCVGIMKENFHLKVLMIRQSDSYNKILQKYDDLPKQQKKIADYIIQHFDEVVFLSITRLSNVLEVSEATIVRFAQNLGHKGFPELKKDLVKYYRDYLTPGERMKRSIEALPDDPFNFAQIVESEIQLLKSAVSTIDRGSLMRAVDAILKANNVYIFGNGGNECLANHLTFRLARFKLKVVQQSVSGKNLFEKLLSINKDDLIIDYHFYKSTIDFRRLMNVAEDKGVSVLLITDSILPPLIKKASIVLHAERGPAGRFHSQVVPIAINNAIINGVAGKLGDKAVLALSELNQMRKKFYYIDFADKSVQGEI